MECCAALLQELVAALDSQQAAAQRLTEAAVEQHLPRDVELLPPHETGVRARGSRANSRRGSCRPAHTDWWASRCGNPGRAGGYTTHTA